MPEPTNKVSLGCGTLILIAVIVLIFGNANNDKDLLAEVRRLRSDVRSLKNAATSSTSENARHSEIKALRAEIQSQSAALARIQADLEKIAERPAMPRARILPPAPNVEAE